MQHTITTSKGKWLLVEVPVNSDTYSLIRKYGGWALRYFVGKECLPCKYLDVVNPKLIATTSTITEDQAAEIVELSDLEIELVIFKNYQGLPFSYDNATASFRSLLQANQIPTEKVYVIIKIKE